MVSKKTIRKRNHLREFLNESSIHGLRLLLFYTPFRYARLLWKILIIAIIIWAHYIVIYLIMEYIDQPTEVRMSTNRVHISQSPFPAVAVCGANKFSRVKLQKYAEKVFDQQQLYRPYYLARTHEEMTDTLLMLYDFFIFPLEERRSNSRSAQKLDHILSFMYNTTRYPTRDILRELAPDCENLIIRGIVYGLPVNVSDYWTKRVTTSGVCCMFNYKRRSYAINEQQRKADNDFIQNREPIQFEANSILNSVQFVLQSDVDDFTITDFNIDAFFVSVFPPEDYPNLQSAHIGEILVAYNSIVEIPVKPEFYESTQRVRQFPPTVRQCYYSDEGQKLLNTSFYSIDECLMKCRMLSMMKHCGCVAPPMVATFENVTYCNLMDLKCLRQWNTLWYGWDYFDYVDAANSDVLEDSTLKNKCPHCLPTCNGVRFHIILNEMSLRPVMRGRAYRQGLLKGLNNDKPLAIIKLYFQQRFAQATITDVVADWVVHLNRFGGIMSLMYGFSFISAIEIFYYGTGKFLVLHMNNLRVKVKRKVSRIATAIGIGEQEDVELPPPSYHMYWNELIPKTTINIALKCARQENKY